MSSLAEGLRKRVYAVYCYFTFAQAECIIKKGNENKLIESSAREIHPKGSHPKNLLKRFSKIYNSSKGKEGNGMDVTWALARMHWAALVRHVIWAIAESSIRLLMPFALRSFLIWLEDFKNDEAEIGDGWLRGGVLIIGSILMVLTHHPQFWIGYIVGFKMRVTLMSAIHEKLLGLNASSITKVTTGRVIALSSTDVRKIEQVMITWQYLIVVPLMVVYVLFALTSVLGLIPAVAGTSCILAVIPLQVFLSKAVVKYRRRIAVENDKRIGMTGELISGVLAVKMLGWEESLIGEVDAVRRREHNNILKKNCIVGAKVALRGILQVITVCVVFVTHRFTEGELNAPDVFFGLSLMTPVLLSVTGYFLTAANGMSEALVTLKRADMFFKLPEPLPIGQSTERHELGSVQITRGNFGWYAANEDSASPDQSKSLLRIPFTRNGVKHKEAKKPVVRQPQLSQALIDVNISIKPGELVGVAGAVGSGKSSLLAALLNDMELISISNGPVISGEITYCSQTPWIMSGSVRDNIVFGSEFDEERYWRVIECCALNIDFEQFPNNDETELGERGINISGGQKARIALARAAYKQADVHLLDDPLSAVDPRVGHMLFEKCIGSGGVMNNSTRLLATHQRHFLPLCDRIILIKDGCVEATGTWSELEDHPILKTAATVPATNENPSDSTSLSTAVEQQSSDGEAKMINNSTTNEASQSGRQNQISEGKSRLVVTEGKKQGKIAFAVYWQYARYIGILPFLSSLSVFAIALVLLFLSEWWVSVWASTDAEDQKRMKWVWVLIVFSSLSAVASLVAVVSFFTLLMAGSSRLHSQMIRCVMHAPLKFFHTNPSGRILNRFAKDLGLQDEELPDIAGDVFRNVLWILGTFVILAIALPHMIAFFVVVAWIFWRTRQRYVITSREVKRFDGITRSPVYAMLSSNIRGLATIRAFGREEKFQEEFMDKLDHNSTWWTSFLLTSRWVGVRMDAISSLVFTVSVLIALLLAKSVPAKILGLALTYTLSLSGLMQWTMRQSAELENNMTAVERNMEYTNLEQEPPTAAQGGGDRPKAWPSNGEIQYSSVTASYRPGLDPVLENLSFVIPGGSSVGIVGRTGSGKSSLMLTLFRLIDINAGEIRIDGVDTASIGIDVLRKQLAIIPQDPVLFGGTLRSNLDPWNEQSDARLWDVLQQVCLDEVAKQIGGLNARISECGGNFSTGQRQLLCLARALLTDAKILALDEATANVDRKTDALIQESIRSVTTKRDRTLLIIAHRIDTVMDCDLILVLNNGQLVEFGSPNDLRKLTNGVFAAMVASTRHVSSFSARSS